jgi:predicted small metal-binding protein
MTRKYIDCREMPSESNCSVAISADSETELVEAAVQHAISVHGHTDGPELRQGIREHIHDGMPPYRGPTLEQVQRGRDATPPH